ncbi:MAG: MFS transporter [Firmicutes bacterium]|nr:MFS transporter [Bacillota bacterium]
MKEPKNINETRIQNLEPVKPEDKVPFSEKLWYGIGDLYGGGNATMIALILLIFFTDVVGLLPFLAGLVIMVAKFADAFSDPFVGVISDNIRGKFADKYGRRKPFMFIGGLIIIPSLLMIFAPIHQVTDNQAVKTIYMLVAYVIYCIVTTVAQVPYTAMANEISLDYRERDSANFYKLIFNMVAAAVCYLVPSLLYEAYQDGKIGFYTFYIVISVGIGALFTIPLCIAALVVKERVPYSKEKTKFDIKKWFKSFKIKSFKYHIFMYIAGFLCMDIVSALALYYSGIILVGQTISIFGNSIELQSTFIIAPMMVVAGISILFYLKVIKTRPKQFGYRLGLPLYIIGGIGIAIWQPGWNPFLPTIFAMIMGVGLGGAQMMPWLIFPDVIDAAELRLGYRPTGSFSSMMTLARKLATAFALQLVGIVLSIAGYREAQQGQSMVADQPASVILAIRVMFGASITVLISWAIYSSLKYKVTNHKLLRLRYFTELQREGRIKELTREEREERVLLMKELT